jgi:hypothetical protein
MQELAKSGSGSVWLVLDTRRPLVGIDYFLVVSGGCFLASLLVVELAAGEEHSGREIYTGLRRDHQIPAYKRERSGVPELHSSVLVRGRLECKSFWRAEQIDCEWPV